MEQPGWRWCAKCYGLFFSGNPSQGSCPVDRGAHDGATSGAYSVDLDAPHEGGQSGWRWCAKCQGLFFGGNPTPGRCPAGAAHDGSGSSDYTLDSEGPMAPGGAQRGWRWCNQCEGLFYAGGPAPGMCPAGGPHVAEGSGAYVVKHQPVPQVQASLAEVKLAMPRVAFMRMMQVTTPVFLRAQAAKLDAGPTASISATDGVAWCGLAGWLDQPAHAADAIVQCRRSGLTVQLDARTDPAVQLLPLDGSSPQAALLYADEGQTKREPLQAIVDVQKRSLKLVREFSAAEGELFDKIMGGLSSSLPATVDLSYTHRYRVKQPVPRPRPWLPPAEEMVVEREVRDHRTQVDPQVRDHRTMPARLANPMVNPALRANLDAAARANQPRAPEPAPEPAPRPAAARPTAGPFAWRNPGNFQNQQAWTAWMKAHPNALKDWRQYRPDYRRLPVDDDPPDPAEGITDATFTHQFAIGVNRPISDEAAFPDYSRRDRQGWGQVPGRTGKTALHFRTSDRADNFFFLPTAFKLGYYVAPGGEGAGLPPMRVELYLDATGAYRVKVTLVALPFIDDADREALRAHLREVVLRRNPPYVGLELKAGLQAKLVPDYTAGSAADVQVLPASIRFTAKEERPNDRLELEFDMEAASYAIFCELLRRGLTGRVQVSEPDGVEESIAVRLELDDIITNSLLVEGGTAADPAAPVDPAAEAAPATGITIRNVLGDPVHLSSLRVHLVDRGALVGMVVDAEEVTLLPEGRDLGPSGDPAASSFTLPFPSPTHVGTVDEAVVVPGVPAVKGRSPDEWLNQVNRDGSLQQEDFRVSVELSIPVAGKDRVQLVNLQVLKDGDTTPPQPGRRIRPSDAPLDLAVKWTLADLMGQSGKPATYSLEVDCLYTDQSLSLPQRVALDPEVDSLVLSILVEHPTSRYTVRYEGRSEEHDRAGAAALVNRLRGEGKRWDVYATQPPPA